MTTMAVHTDVVCPPDPNALCVCGDQLQAHIPQDDPDNPPTPATGACPDDGFHAWRDARPVNLFHLAPGQSLDCSHVQVCDICDVDICSEHSTEFVSCAGSRVAIHHHECLHSCPDCVDAARQDARDRR